MNPNGVTALLVAACAAGCGVWRDFWSPDSIQVTDFPAPSIAAVSPDNGFDTGGTVVTIAGAEFVQGVTVAFGGVAAAVTSVVAAQIVATTPAQPGLTGTVQVDVVVTNPDGQSAVRPGGFLYFIPVPWINVVVPASGPNTGGATITIAGGSFVAGATVTVGGQLAGSVTVWGAWQLTCVTPTLAPADGPMNVVVTNPNGRAGTLIGGYTMVGAPGALAQSFGTGGVVGSDPSSGQDGAWAVLQDGSNLYVGGWDESPGTGDWRVRVEKRSLATGAPVAGFGSGGAVLSNPSTGSEWVEAMVRDGSSLYLLGPDDSPGNTQWRVEKRSLATGALVTGFGSGGVVTSNPSSGLDHPVALLTDGANLYLVGLDDSFGVGNDQWRIEKRSMATGALVTGFGVGGVVTSNPSSGQDWPLRAVMFGSAICVVGFDQVATSLRWRIEMRSLSTGAGLATFGSFGAVTSDPSTGSDEAWNVATDGTDLYVVGTDWSPGDAQWRIERRSGTTGALVAGFGSGGVVTTNPSTALDGAWGVLVDAGRLYVVGEDRSPGATDAQWRLERRSLTTGALDTAFGTGGVVTVNPSAGNDVANALLADATAIYVVGDDTAPGSPRFRIEKRWK